MVNTRRSKSLVAASVAALTPMFEQALQEAVNKERARCIAVMRSYHSNNMTALDDLATWEVLQAYVEIISPGGQPGRTRAASPF